MVHQVPAGASIASLPWHGARVAGAPPHKSLGARAPTDTVPADDAGVFAVCSTIVRTRCVALAVSPASLSPEARILKKTNPPGLRLVWTNLD